MNSSESYDTLSQAIEGLRGQGYTYDFNVSENCIECSHLDLIIHPDDFQVDKVFRFEGDSSTDDSSAVYAIISGDGKVKGILVTAYGVYADPMSAELLRKLS